MTTVHTLRTAIHIASTCAKCATSPVNATECIVGLARGVRTYCRTCVPPGATIVRRSEENVVTCPSCNTDIRHNAVLHMQHCPARPVACKICEKLIPAGEHTKHEQTCAYTMLQCVHCGMPGGKLADHNCLKYYQKTHGHVQ